MVYKSAPLDILLEFENRKYRLSDTIDTTVTLIPSSNTNIRKASLDLMLEVRSTEVKVTQSAGMIGGVIGGGNAFGTTDYIPTRQTKSSKSETIVHSYTQFLNKAALKAGNQTEYRVALQINPDPPKRLAEAKERVKDSNSSITFHWRLVVKVDVVRGRNPKVQRKINVDLS